MTRSRWFDFPLTREESLVSDKKLTINFGPSFDPAGVNIVDSVQIYGKSKDAFGWPEDQDEFSGPSTSQGNTPKFKYPHTVILPDRTLKKWGLSNFAF